MVSKLLLTICFIFLLSISSINAELIVGKTSSSNIIELGEEDTLANINSSEFWVTNVGALDGVNTTQFSYSAGNLNIIESYIQKLITGGTGEIDTWRLNYTRYYTGLQVNSVVQGNASGGTDTWQPNKTFYYNKSQVDNNFSLYFTRTQILSFDYNSTFNQTYQNYAFLNQSNNSLFLQGFNWSTNPFFDRWALDTNATTECNDGEYLDGDGNCYPITTSRTYNASSIVLEQGVHDGGDIGSIQSADDGDTYNISEEGGINSLRVNITFCDVEDIDFIAIHYWYDDGTHALPIGLWDFVNGGFEFEYGSMPATPTFHWYSHAVLDADTHINESGCVILQLDHDGTGISSHDLYLDAVFLLEGNQLSTVNSIFQLNDRDDPTALDWAWDKNGSKNATGNWNMGNYSITNISWIFPEKINWTNEQVNETQFSFSNLILEIKKSWLFKLFYTKTESNNNLNNNITVINTTSNIQSLGFVTGDHTIDTWRLNHTKYYNGTLVNEVVQGNLTSGDTWQPNKTFYYNKSQVDNNLSLKVSKTGDTMSGNLTMGDNTRIDDDESNSYIRFNKGTLVVVLKK